MVSIGPSPEYMKHLNRRDQASAALDYGDTNMRYAHMREFREWFYGAMQKRDDIQYALCQLVCLERLIRQRQEINDEFMIATSKWRSLSMVPTDNLTEEGHVYLNSALAFAKSKSMRMSKKLFEHTNYMKTLL